MTGDSTCSRLEYRIILSVTLLQVDSQCNVGKVSPVNCKQHLRYVRGSALNYKCIKTKTTQWLNVILSYIKKGEWSISMVPPSQSFISFIDMPPSISLPQFNCGHLIPLGCYKRLKCEHILFALLGWCASCMGEARYLIWCKVTKLLEN